MDPAGRRQGGRREFLLDGTVIVKCRDLPELLSWPAEGETPEGWARFAVEDCITFRMKDGEKIPVATPPEPGEFVVRLTATAEVKILLHNEMVEAGVSRAELGCRAGMRLPDVSRLLNIRHPPKSTPSRPRSMRLEKTSGFASLRAEQPGGVHEPGRRLHNRRPVRVVTNPILTSSA